jgi:hypothetical protein
MTASGLETMARSSSVMFSSRIPRYSGDDVMHHRLKWLRASAPWIHDARWQLPTSRLSG